MISSHLSPEPERRLWIILENVRHAVERAELKLAAAAVLTGAELALLLSRPERGPAAAAAAAALAAAFLAALAAFAGWLPARLDSRELKDADDNLVTPEGLAKYTHGDLIARLDKFLGGGITNTKYFEDIIEEIQRAAREGARKRRAFRGVAALAAVGQLCLAAQGLRHLLSS